MLLSRHSRAKSLLATRMAVSLKLIHVVNEVVVVVDGERATGTYVPVACGLVWCMSVL